ncbi:oxygen-independent coproporphyrinogen-3 oxidase [Streptomyces puniciscabiei]|uniref:Heme chaperone HemW n=1 Tax=Streptomyces puniciscabiei TaxID=164348 RepID=A0A542THG3_9ACTN|nr:radical SAM protein [Streptomyces puniciscabiei]TQK86285.1 oxygen-independent coproporphyrinogen-3 oxidase [Streptomyces puniciscabiei]
MSGSATTSAIRDELAGYIRQGVIPPFNYAYPSRSAYRPLNGSWNIQNIWAEDLERHSVPELNLYLHVPFCRYKCGFCNLYTVISEDMDVYDAYTDALCTQIRDHTEILQSRRLRTIYIGGGTPSLLSLRHFEQLFATFDEVYPNWRSTVEEVAIEATPDSVVKEPGTLEGLIAMGLTRANIGIQSLVPAEIREAGRGQANERVIREAIEIIRDKRLPNLSTDLIMGFAGQTPESWCHSVDELVALAPETISAYFLTVRPDAWFSKTGAYQYMWNPDLYERYDYANAKFREAGYIQESNVRYKKLGRGGYQQKVLTFHGVPLLGLGAGARSYTSAVDYMVGDVKPSITEVADYISKARNHELTPQTGFVLNDEEIIRKRLVLDTFDLDLRELERFGYREKAHLFEPVLSAAEEVGLLRRLPTDRIQLTPEGFKYRDILSWMFFSKNVIDLDRAYYERLHQQNRRARKHMGGEPVRISGLKTARP